MELTFAQRQAIYNVERASTGVAIDRSMRITISFHPDRVFDGLHILDSLAQSGIYKSQFETKTSNGGLTAHVGGDRWVWESRIFGSAYDNASCNERPKYGGLNYKKCSFGSSPRFGSSYLLLKEEVTDRCTFCYPDSVFEPVAFGTAQRMSLVPLALSDDKDLLDDYVEAQIHGDILISRDVEAIVLDPSYRNTEVERLANKLGCRVEWHCGFVLTIEEMERYQDFRGEEIVALGRKFATNSLLTPRTIGLAAAEGKYDLQSLKKVWHYLARYGQLSG